MEITKLFEVLEENMCVWFKKQGMNAHGWNMAITSGILEGAALCCALEKVMQGGSNNSRDQNFEHGPRRKVLGSIKYVIYNFI